jgi:hypothetical protein
MFTPLLRFIWIAFGEYFGVWVTGTGIVGILLWILNYVQGTTGKQMKPRYYATILFCTFWFLATFSAWHDADKKSAIGHESPAWNPTIPLVAVVATPGDLSPCEFVID